MGQCYSRVLDAHDARAGEAGFALHRHESLDGPKGATMAGGSEKSMQRLTTQISAKLSGDCRPSASPGLLGTVGAPAKPDSGGMLTPELLAQGSHAVCILLPADQEPDSKEDMHMVSTAELQTELLRTKLRFVVAWASRGCLHHVKAKSLQKYSRFLQELLSTDSGLVNHLKEVAELATNGKQLDSTVRVVIVYGPAESSSSTRCTIHALGLRPCNWVFNGKSYPGIAIEHIPTHVPPEADQAPAPASSKTVAKTRSRELGKAIESVITPPSAALHPMAVQLARLMAAVDSSPIIMTVCTLDGKVVYQNASSVGYAGSWLTQGRRDFFGELLAKQHDLYEDLMNSLTLDEPWSRVVQVPKTLSKGVHAAAEVVDMPHSMSVPDRRRCSIDFKATNPSTVSKDAWHKWRGASQTLSQQPTGSRTPSVRGSVPTSALGSTYNSTSTNEPVASPLAAQPRANSVRKRASSSWLLQALEGHEGSLMNTNASTTAAHADDPHLQLGTVDMMRASDSQAPASRPLSKRASVNAPDHRPKSADKGSLFGDMYASSANGGSTNSGSQYVSEANAGSSAGAGKLSPAASRRSKSIKRSQTFGPSPSSELTASSSTAMAPTRQRLMSLMEAAAHTSQAHVESVSGNVIHSAADPCFVRKGTAKFKHSTSDVQDLFEEPEHAGYPTLASARTEQQRSRFAHSTSTPVLEAEPAQPAGPCQMTSVPGKHPTQQTAPSAEQQPLSPVFNHEEKFCWHEMHIIPFIDPETATRVALVAQMDVTERSELEQRLMQLTEAQLYMLENMFPRHILERMACMVGAQPSQAPQSSMLGLLKELSQSASHHDCVTIMFTDIVGFTSMSKEVQPEQVMSFLNQLFSLFDDLVNKHKVYKVETDEDGFRALAQDNKASSRTRAARRVLNFATDMMRVAKTVLMPNNGLPVQQRVGVHSGPVVSGLIGQLLPKFALFGDTMNTASRMESTSIPGRIQVSEATHQLLDDPSNRWECTGGVKVKGKGVMNTYLLAEHSMHLEPKPAQTSLGMYDTDGSLDFARLMSSGSKSWECGSPLAAPVYEDADSPGHDVSNWNTNALCTTLLRTFSIAPTPGKLQSSTSTSIPSTPPGPASLLSIDNFSLKTLETITAGRLSRASQKGLNNQDVARDSASEKVLRATRTSGSCQSAAPPTPRTRSATGPGLWPPDSTAQTASVGSPRDTPLQRAVSLCPPPKPAAEAEHPQNIFPLPRISERAGSSTASSSTRVSSCSGAITTHKSLFHHAATASPLGRDWTATDSLDPSLLSSSSKALDKRRSSTAWDVESLQAFMLHDNQSRCPSAPGSLPSDLHSCNSRAETSDAGDEVVLTGTHTVAPRKHQGSDYEVPLRIQLAYGSLNKANKSGVPQDGWRVSMDTSSSNAH